MEKFLEKIRSLKDDAERARGEVPLWDLSRFQKVVYYSTLLEHAVSTLNTIIEDAEEGGIGEQRSG